MMKKKRQFIILASSVILLLATGWMDPVFEVQRAAYGFMNPEKFLLFLTGEQEALLFDGMSVIAVLIATFAGGVALNLTPCVLPMIPVNLSIIGAGNKKEKKKDGILRALIYSSGMIAACGFTGLAAIFGGASLGGLAATWYFNLIAAVVFLVLGASMFDLFTLDLSRYQNKFKTPSSAKLLGVFLLGCMTALLAGACVAPVVIAIMIYSAGLYASGIVWGIFLPFLLGLGMALPWPLLAAGISFLPKPGAWMNHVKHFFGLLIILIGIYYGVQASKLFFAEHNPKQIVSGVSLSEAIERSKASGKPVLVDFYADWCKNCIAMEHSTFQDPDVKKTLQNFEFVRFDATRSNDPDVQEVLEFFDIKGLPAFLILKTDNFQKGSQ